LSGARNDLAIDVRLVSQTTRFPQREIAHDERLPFPRRNREPLYHHG